MTSALEGLSRAQKLYTVPVEGGLPEKLPVPYGANGSIDRTGEWLAYTPHSTDNRTWKRYRGGMATDVWLVNLKSGESRRITDWEGNTVFLPITASACMIFSLLAIVKVTPENAQLLCMADLLLDWYGFSQTSNKSS